MQSWTSTGCFSNSTGSFVNNCRFSPIIDGVAATSHNLAQAQALQVGWVNGKTIWAWMLKGHITLELEGPLTHDIPIIGLVEMPETVQVHFTLTLKAWETKEIWTDETSTWLLTWQQVGNVSWSIGCCIRPINKRWVFYRTRGCGNQLNRRWLL